MKRTIFLLGLMGTIFIAPLSTQNSSNKIEVTWIGHSCFEIKYLNQRILIDPFTPEWFDYERPQGKYNFVFASHKAQDHYFFEGIDADVYLLASGQEDTFSQQSSSGNNPIKGKTSKNVDSGTFTFWTVPSYHDNQKGAVDGVNGILCLDFDGITVVHLGDIGHVLEEDHLKKIGPVDVLMIPVDGYFTIDIDTAKKIIDQLNPSIVLPMHYKTERSKLTQPIYTEKELLERFVNIKKLHQSQLVIDENALTQRQSIILLEYLHDGPKRPYLGQKPPGMTPKIFAPGIISTENLGEGSCAFTQDALLFLFNRRWPPEEHKTIYMTELKNGRWTEPIPAPFNSEYQDWDFHFAPNGKSFYFTSKRPTENSSESSRHANIWVTHLTSSGWTPPQILEYPINTADSHSCGASLTKDGTLYFFSGREGGFGGNDIYRAKRVNEKYLEVENLGKAINTEYWEYDLFIAPDESYLIFSSDRPGGYGEFNDIYITFRRDDATWTEPKNLGQDFRDSGVCCVTLDSRYLFFATGRTGNDDIYWVDARFINDLKPDELK